MMNRDEFRFSDDKVTAFGKWLRRVMRDVVLGFDTLTHVQFDRPWDHTARRRGWPGSRGV